MSEPILDPHRRLIVVLSNVFYLDLLLVALLQAFSSISGPIGVWLSLLVVMIGVSAGLVYFWRAFRFLTGFCSRFLADTRLDHVDGAGSLRRQLRNASRQALGDSEDFLNREEISPEIKQQSISLGMFSILFQELLFFLTLIAALLGYFDELVSFVMEFVIPLLSSIPIVSLLIDLIVANTGAGGTTIFVVVILLPGFILYVPIRNFIDYSESVNSDFLSKFEEAALRIRNEFSYSIPAESVAISTYYLLMIGIFILLRWLSLIPTVTVFGLEI